MRYKKFVEKEGFKAMVVMDDEHTDIKSLVCFKNLVSTDNLVLFKDKVEAINFYNSCTEQNLKLLKKLNHWDFTISDRYTFFKVSRN